MERQAVTKAQNLTSANKLQPKSGRSGSANHPLQALQQSIGNQAMQRLIDQDAG